MKKFFALLILSMALGHVCANGESTPVPQDETTPAVEEQKPATPEVPAEETPKDEEPTA